MSSLEGHRLLEESPLRSPSLDNLHVNESPVDSLGSDSSSIAALELPADGLIPVSPRTLTNLNGLALVIGLQIGSGIFSAPSVVISKVSSPAVAIFVWLLAGALVWMGASSFIEL